MARQEDRKRSSVDPPAGRNPDFIVIGAMKSGTTSLYQYLLRHPRIFMSDMKEPQFFSREDTYARGEAWYRSLFADSSADQLCGEASTCYTRWPHFGNVAGRIHQHLSEVKLVYLLRHPVDRAYSHYRHIMEERVLRRTGPVVSFAQALDEIPEIVDTSLYLRQIERYLEYFPRERLLVITLDDLQRQPGPTLKKVHEFLGVDPVDLPAARAAVSNRSGDRTALFRTRQQLVRLRQAPVLSRVIDYMPAGGRRRAKALLTRRTMARLLTWRSLRKHRQRISPFRSEERARLLEHLSAPTRDLEAYMDRLLPGWFE